MALLRSCLVSAALLMAVPVHGHYMGKTVPIGYTGDGVLRLAAHVVAGYFEEQMGRETKLVEEVSLDQCLRSIREREFPMAVVPEDTVRSLPEDIVVMEKKLGPPGNEAALVMGGDARKKLEFSLVPSYMDRLSKGLAPSHWKKALSRLEAGEGVRRVALDMLREADLL